MKHGRDATKGSYKEIWFDHKEMSKNPERDAEPQARERNHQEMQKGHNIAVKTILWEQTQRVWESCSYVGAFCVSVLTHFQLEMRDKLW